MSKHWRWLLILGYPLLAVNLLLALLYAIVWARASSWQLREGVLTFVARREMLGHPGGQGWSPIVGYKSEVARDTDHLRVHENCHVVQEMVFAVAGGLAGVVVATESVPLGIVVGLSGGLVFAVLYGLSFLILFAGRGFKDWHEAYLKIPFEVQAYAKQDAYRYATVEHRAGRWGNAGR